MKKRLLFAILILGLTYSFAQIPDTVWTKTYGDSSHDFGSSIIQSDNNTFIISGGIGTDVSGGGYLYDIWAFGIDENGTSFWSYNYGGLGGGELVSAFNNEFFMAAETFNQGSWEDMHILKINRNGDTLWSKTFYYSQHEYKPEIERTEDGGIIILGYTYGFPTGTLLIRLNSSGDTLWTKLFSDDTYQLFPSALQIDNDGGFLFLINKLDSTFIYKTDSSGNLLWISKICSAPYFASKLLVTQEENYMILGIYQSDFDSSYIWTSLLDRNFNTIYSKIYFFSSKYFSPATLTKSNNEGYIIIGEESEESFTSTEGFIMKINDSGELVWKRSYGGIYSVNFSDIVLLENNEFLIVGRIEQFENRKSEAWVLRFSADTVTTSIGYDFNSNLPINYSLNQNYPNPFNPSTKISWQSPLSSWQNLKIYDMLGNEVATLVDEFKPGGSYEVEWNASGLASGIYFYKLQAGDFTETKKLILMK